MSADPRPYTDEGDAEAEEQELTGGGTARVFRVGETVRKPVMHWTPAVHRLLAHLERQGFEGAPAVHGTDGQGRMILTYLAGDVGNYPLPDAIRSSQALTTSAHLLRRYHDATTDLAQHPGGDWQFEALAPVEVICHGDFAPYNCVFTGESAVGLIDFDAARPGPRAWDLAYALYRYAPLTHPDNHDGCGTTEQQAYRARDFLDAYGCARQERQSVMDMAAPRLQSLADFLQEAAAAGDENFQRHIEEGHLALYVRDITYIRDRAEVWSRLVVGR
ncbi:phosphotransferase [Streptomyces sp. NPDC051665]|uniref:phosphotransferase enzyme family protein n=1 Tax=Streptomyces sp. NPDC051665 TaxID=3154647 RepID=UPI0034306AAC